MAQYQIDMVFMAMGYPWCSDADLTDELIFERVREQFEERAARLEAA